MNNEFKIEFQELPNHQYKDELNDFQIRNK